MFDEARLGMSAVSLRIERIHHRNEKTSRGSASLTMLSLSCLIWLNKKMQIPPSPAYTLCWPVAKTSDICHIANLLCVVTNNARGDAGSLLCRTSRVKVGRIAWEG